jgi:small-conductance mechanosensitive channel
LKWTAVVAVLTLTVMAGVRSSTATKQPTATVAQGADLANEERALAKYFEDLVSYNHQTAQLSAKAKLVSADLDPLQRRSDDLKGRLSGLQNVIREIVTKLKAANEWSDLDITTAAKITDARQKAYIEQESFKQLLEESSNGLTSHANEISLPLDNLRKKLTSRYGDGADVQFVRAAYGAPAPMTFVSLACSVGRIQLGLGHRLHRSASDGLLDTVSCNCNPGAGIGIATGTPCSQVLAK